jgi:hypothetical protein
VEQRLTHTHSLALEQTRTELQRRHEATLATQLSQLKHALLAQAEQAKVIFSLSSVAHTYMPRDFLAFVSEQRLVVFTTG